MQNDEKIRVTSGQKLQMGGLIPWNGSFCAPGFARRRLEEREHSEIRLPDERPQSTDEAFRYVRSGMSWPA
jgi:hypothetical protein